MLTALPPTPPGFMEQAMQFERLRGNLFKVIDPGSGNVRIVDAPMLAQSIANAAKCYREYRTAESAEIIQFPDRGHG